MATEHTRFFRHGIVAARIKPQRAKGMHSGFWMLPSGTTYADGNPAAGTEIDVMEFFGENGRGTETISSSIHYYQAGWNKVSLGDPFPAARRVLARKNDWWDEFHVFSVEWTPTEYVFRIDGREYYRETEAVSQAQQYLVLSNLTSDYELAELTADEMADTAQVDWVRVFDASSTAASRATHGRRVGRCTRLAGQAVRSESRNLSTFSTLDQHSGNSRRRPSSREASTCATTYRRLAVSRPGGTDVGRPTSTRSSGPRGAVIPDRRRRAPPRASTGCGSSAAHRPLRARPRLRARSPRRTQASGELAT